MSNKLTRELPKTTSIWQKAEQGLGLVLDVLISIYMLLIIVVMPFYYEDGYSHIGTDKATFFRKVGSYSWKIVLPVFAVYLIVRVIVKLTVNGGRKTGSPKLGTWCKAHLTECFAALYGIGLLLSYACSDYKTQALRGATGWYMGLLPQLLLLGSFFFIAFLWKPKKWLAGLFLPVSAVVFLLGVLNRFGIYPIDMGMENWGFISTIGNINWYCGYMVSVFFGGYYLLWQSEKSRISHQIGAKASATYKWQVTLQIFLILYLAIGFSSLVTQASESGLFALAVICIAAFGMSAGDAHAMKMFWVNSLILCLTCTVLWMIRLKFPGQITYTEPLSDILTNSWFPVMMGVFSLLVLLLIVFGIRKNKYPTKKISRLIRGVLYICLIGGVGAILFVVANTLTKGAISSNPLFIFSPKWGSDRGATWLAGLYCFGEQNIVHKIFGVGPDCMSAYIYQNGGAELKTLVEECFGNQTLTNAHNEWLTVLVDTGILGFIGFVGMMVSAMVRLLKQKESLIAGACGLCLLAYTANNMFSFQQSMNTATIFVVLGMGMAFARKRNS